MDDSHTFFWLVGLFEGEASFLFSATHGSPRIELEMVDEHVVARVAALFSVSYCRRDRRKESKHSVSYRWSISGARAMQLMKRMQPYLSPRRARQITSIEERYLRERKRVIDYSKIVLPVLADIPYTVTRE